MVIVILNSKILTERDSSLSVKEILKKRTLYFLYKSFYFLVLFFLGKVIDAESMGYVETFARPGPPKLAQN